MGMFLDLTGMNLL